MINQPDFHSKLTVVNSTKKVNILTKYVLEDESAPAWLMTIFVDRDGIPYFPVGDFVEERIAWKIAGGEVKWTLIYWDDHIYAEADWIAEKFPSAAFDCLMTKKKYLEAVDNIQYTCAGNYRPAVTHI